MPPRSHPTARQERLGAELRKLREAAGMTAREAAGLLGTNPMQMSHMETGRAGISDERLRRLASHCACTDIELIDALVAMATDRTHGWWEDYRGVLPPSFLDLAELEHHATFLRIIGVVHIPGLLQTEAYARAVFSFVVPDLPSSDLESRVQHRMQRKQVVERDKQTPYQAVIHEAALHFRVADKNTTQEQLECLLLATERKQVTIRVIPFDRDNFAGAGCSMLHAGGPVENLDTFQRDTAHGSGFLTADAELSRLRQLFTKVEKMALGEEDSRELIHRIKKDT